MGDFTCVSNRWQGRLLSPAIYNFAWITKYFIDLCQGLCGEDCGAVGAGMCPHAGSFRAVCLGAIVGGPTVVMNSCAVCGSFMGSPLSFRGGGILCRCPVGGSQLVVNGFYSITYKAGFLFGDTGRALHSLSGCAFPLFFKR